MIVYHGTTNKRAQRICVEGFLPKKPSRRVWFAQSRGYALGRAKTQARRARARPVVLTCNLDIGEIKRLVGPRRVFFRGGILAISGRVPVHVLRSGPAGSVHPRSHEELAAWVNRVLRVKPHKGAGRHHPGIDRLERWVANRETSQPRNPIRDSELLQLARQWLPEFFEGVAIDPETLRVSRQVKTIEVEVQAPEEPTWASVREQEALACLEGAQPRQRIRGLEILAAIDDPDLSEWCAMCLEDEATDVRVAALRTMLRCDEADVEVLVPLATSPEKRIRAGAIAALARHSAESAPHWFERGLRDPDPCVRVETAAILSKLDPVAHRSIFLLALHDPNPDIE